MSGLNASELVDANARCVRAVDEMLETYTKNSASRNVVGEHIAVLGDKAVEISSVTRQVLDVAGHVELVALNARVEAMHAGAAGRSFAVVADEVKRLSQQVAALARTIDALVGDIKDEISSTQRDMNTAKQQGALLQASFENVKESIDYTDGIVARLRNNSI